MSRQQEIARAAEASRLLSGPVFKDAFEQARAQFVKEWEQAEDTARREMCWAKVAGLDEVQRQLRRIVSTGEYASLAPDER